MKSPTVFISYSHDSSAHDDRVLELSDRLRADGIDCTIDQYESSPPEGWPKWMDRRIANDDFVLLVCTETYLRRVMGEEPFGKGQGVKWESTLTYQHIYNNDSLNTRFIPILFENGKVEHIPTPLQGATYYRVPADYEKLYRRLTNQPSTTKPDLGKLRTLPRRERKPDFFAPKVSLAKLPSTNPDLFGREKELAMLDAAWSGDSVILSREAAKNLATDSSETLRFAQGDKQKVNVLSLVAWGGVGKTALVNAWLNRMARDIYRGAERVFGWSFYSQGAAEGRQVSADQFIAAALAWFGDPDPNLGSPWDKGERLAELVKQSRTLLILDGLEPLQNPPPVETGRIKDPALVALLRELARQNAGLLVITTRLAVDDLKSTTVIARPSDSVIASRAAAKQSPSRDSGIASSPNASRLLAMTQGGGSAIQLDLDNLSPEAGAAYLTHLGVDGTDEEKWQAAGEYKGHALALTLLGRYLVDVLDRDIRKRDQIPRLTDEEEKGGHAKRVIRAYEKWFAGKPECDLLSMMGLFDRPAPKGAMDALLAASRIKGLTDQIHGSSPEKYKLVLKHLRQARLLAEPDPHDPDTLDCHPLLREHFAEQLKRDNPAAWREGNRRLYEYYKSAAKEFPETIAEMAPLYAAVLHGCQAGKHQEALIEVYWKRIARGKEFFATSKLGAFGADLAALSGFFDPPWRKPVDGLREADKGFVLNAAGFRLRALGRLAEAAQPMQASLDVMLALKNWKEAAIRASNLSELYLTIGDVAQALTYAKQSVELADKSGDAFWRMGTRTTFADALHQAGRLAEADAAFREAEEMQKKDQPEFPLLYSVQGYQYCDLLLSQGKHQEVQRRASQTIEIAKRNRWLLDIALDNLSLGRAHLALSLRATEGSEAIPNAELGIASVAALPRNDSLGFLTRAVDGLRQAGTQHRLPLGLLARAEYYRVTGALEKAKQDLDEAFTIATRGGMGLHLADCHFEYTRLALAEHNLAKVRNLRKVQDAREHFATAKKMIEEMGYGRRTPEVMLLSAQIAFAEGNKDKARTHLTKAKATFENMGIKMWDHEVKKLENYLNS